jgi:type I restriction enzyme S subunit
MSELPKGWITLSTGDLGTWRGGGTPPKANTAFWTDGTIPWVSPKDMKRPYIAEAVDNITDAALAGSSTQLIPKQSILVVTRSGILQHSLPVAANTAPVAINQDLKALTPYEGIETDYVMRQLQADAQIILRSCSKSGTTVDSLDFDRFKQHEFRLAPLPEQQRIVGKVDGLTARTARARKELGRIPTLIARYKERLLALAFSGELTKEWRKKYVVQIDLDKLVFEERKAERERNKINGKGRNRSIPETGFVIPIVPEGWDWYTFDDCAWDLTVGHVGPMKERYVEGGIPFLRSMNVRANRIDLQNVMFIDNRFHEELKKSILKPGDLVVVRTGAPGTAAVVPDNLYEANCSDLVIARLIPSLNPHYAAFYLNSEFARVRVRSMQVGVAQQHFNVGAMSQMPIPFAPPTEQGEIVRRIESAFGWLDRMAADHAAAAKLLPKLDAAILAKAFRGELVPQDPNDEPASVLLDRIRQEQADAPPKGSRRSRGVVLSSTARLRDEVIQPRRTSKGVQMTKSRNDPDVQGQPYLTNILKSMDGTARAETLYARADLALVDFYKQLSDEHDRGWLVDDNHWVKAA